MGQLGFPGANCDAHVGCLGVRMIGLHVDGFNFISSCSVLDFNQGSLAIAEQWGEAFELQTRRWQGSYSTAQYVSYSIIDVDVPQALLNQMNSQLDNLQRGRGAHAALSRTSKMARSFKLLKQHSTRHLSLSAAGLRWCCSTMALTCHLTPLLKSSSCLQALHAVLASVGRASASTGYVVVQLCLAVECPGYSPCSFLLAHQRFPVLGNSGSGVCFQNTTSCNVTTTSSLDVKATSAICLVALQTSTRCT